MNWILCVPFLLCVVAVLLSDAWCNRKANR